MSQPSTASWQLASAPRRLLGHVSHRTRWPVPLMSKGSEDACTSSGIATFLLAALHGTACPESNAARAHRWPSLPWSRRGRQSGVTADPAQTPAGLCAGAPGITGYETACGVPCGEVMGSPRVSSGAYLSLSRFMVHEASEE